MWFVFFTYAIPVYFPAKDSSNPHFTGQVINQCIRIAGCTVAVMIFITWVLSLFRKLERRVLLFFQRNLDDIKNLTWNEFEHLVGEIFRNKGYTIEEIGGHGGDDGIDLILYRDGKKTIVQCKHWQNKKVGVKVVRELFGIMQHVNADRGIMMCIGDYTEEAHDWIQNKPIELITGKTLENMLLRAKKNISQKKEKNLLKKPFILRKMMLKMQNKYYVRFVGQPWY